jgi:arogenate/prephenate dehydratase
MKVAFQGVHGAYSEMAARDLLGRTITTVPCGTFEEVFERVEAGSVDRGVIPIENSLAGSIHQNYDLLVAHKCHIVGETHIRIEHVLMCHPSTRRERLIRVRSHPQALAQCSAFFRRHRNVTAESYFDTAGAAESLRHEAPPDTGAIASAYAADLYGLRILKRNLENSTNNYTRFLVIARKGVRPARTPHMKTSIVFTPMSNRPGILFHILGVFALRNIDLLKIESRPDPDSPFEYLFYIDVDGAPSDRAVARAFDHLREVVATFRILGTYPAGKRFVRKSAKS